MKIRAKQFGLSLVETIVVVAVVALMIGLAIPAVKTFMNPMTSSAGVESMISAALSSARAIAAKNQKYAGIRFQQDKNGNQYMIAIINADPQAMGNLTIAYIAVNGLNPIKLPESMGVMDLKFGSSDISSNNDLDDPVKVSNTTTFSVIFSPSGNLVKEDVRVRNRDGIYQPVYDDTYKTCDTNDSIFNGYDAVIKGNIGLFVQDDYPVNGYEEEKSRSSIVIFSKKEFNETVKKWDDYIKDLPVLYISPYTGSIISQK
jgi:Tfp pilus assembly protein FimT